MEYEREIKILVVGDSGVGKTTLVRRFIHDFVPHQEVDSTVCLDYDERVYNLYGTQIKYKIWDISGNEKYREMLASYYGNIDAFIIVFDVTNKSSYYNLETWSNTIKSHSFNPNPTVLFVANKFDLISESELEKDQFATDFGTFFIRTSAKTGEYVKELFHYVAQKQPETKIDISNNMIPSKKKIMLWRKISPLKICNRKTSPRNNGSEIVIS